MFVVSVPYQYTVINGKLCVTPDLSTWTLWLIALSTCDYFNSATWIISITFISFCCEVYFNLLVEMDDERESVMISAEEQKENDLQVLYLSPLMLLLDHSKPVMWKLIMATIVSRNTHLIKHSEYLKLYYLMWCLIIQIFWPYIVGMLTNLGKLPQERIHSMLKMFAMQGPNTRECSMSELKTFLDRKVKDHQLTYSAGVYQLVQGRTWTDLKH